MPHRIGKIIDLWCTGVLILALSIVALAALLGAAAGTVEIDGIVFGIPAFLIFLGGKSVRFILSAG